MLHRCVANENRQMRLRTVFYGYGTLEFVLEPKMPPKKKKSSKKVRKLTKAQKAKLQQEEEERRLREEEARLQAEREEQERLERERKQKEIERLELKDLERRDDELNELRHLLEENHAAVTKWKHDAEETVKWERYMRCDGAPDPAVQREINTYISLWQDDPETDITQVLKECKLALQLVEDLEELLKKASDPLDVQKYQEALINLQELIHCKHNLTSEDILQRASENIDIETGNMQTVVKDDKITLCLWANFKKNPRFKGLNFEEVGLGFSLPQKLAVSDITVRILHTRYDHLSTLARITHQGIHTPSFRCLVGDKEIFEDVVLPDQEKTAEGKGGEEDNNAMQQQKADEEVQSIQESEGRKSVASIRSRKSSLQLSESRRSQIQTQVEALGAESDLINPPSPPKTTDHGTQVVDLMQYTPLGGIFYYDVFYLPPQAHKVNGWEIKQLSDTGLKVFHYPTNEFNLDDKVLNRPLVGVSVTLPDFVVFLKTPQVARWDTAGKQWRMDGITDVSYEEAEAKISFKMDSFQPFVLMQETYANLPFESWELRPLGQDSAVFTVNAAFINLSITIKDNLCMLQSECEKGLSHLLGKWMRGPALQKAMLNSGINIFVNEYTDKCISIGDKDPLTEYAAYEQMALFASACAFSLSKWNARCGPEHVVLQVCEHLDSSPVLEKTWSLYLLGAQRCQKLEITEKSETFSPDFYPGSEFHSTFIHMLQDSMSPDGVARTRKSHHLFIDTVQTLLCATRPLVYSKSVCDLSNGLQ
ncbi:dynein intermediate chain CFAP94, axonemal isoform X2 [Melanotaenia boesemani]|uniref:dynein intermediate chain CFAP94, axonemal isoform X2 n=1 Tax=Melanotaenia boesemani TaxID=1250792 RepID=UPI001C0529F3|nr:dynein intermediate chain CFAP94, axonemal isoform X2 [Melanotaenia boesemani]